MMLLAQATETGLDFAKILGIGGPASAGTLLVVWLVKLLLEYRKDKREDVQSDRQSESQIVATTDALATLIRKQMVDMSVELETLKRQNREDRERYEQEVEKLKERVTILEAENEQLRRAQRG